MPKASLIEKIIKEYNLTDEAGKLMSIHTLEEATGITKNTLRVQIARNGDLTLSMVEKILAKFPMIPAMYLITGKKPDITTTSKALNTKIKAIGSHQNEIKKLLKEIHQLVAKFT